MADFNFTYLAQNFDITSNLAATPTNIGSQFQVTAWAWFSQTNSTVIFQSNVLTFDGANLPASGTFHGLKFSLSGSLNTGPNYDMQVTNASYDATLFAALNNGGLDQSQQNNLFWRLLISGDDGFYFGTTATGNSIAISMAGDGRDVLSGETLFGGNDGFGGDFGFGNIEGDFTNVLAGGTAYGGNDDVYVSGHTAIGDSDSVAGFLSGGHDTLRAAAGGNVGILAGDVRTVLADGIVVGGHDSISAAEATGVTLALGDAYEVFGTLIGGNDTITGSGTLYGDAFYVRSGGTMRAGHDVLYGGSGNDYIRGDGDVEANATLIYGNDSLHGGAGMDTLYGDGGNDVLYIDAPSHDVAAEFYDGGDGNDTLFVSLTNGGVVNLSDDAIFDIETLRLTTITGTVQVQISPLQAIEMAIVGTDSDDIVEIIAIAATTDPLVDLSVKVVVNMNNDGDHFLITGDGGNETLTGSLTVANAIDGGADDDILVGGNLDDTLTGGTGVDWVIGGAGDDILVINEGDLASGETYDGGTYDVGNALMFKGTDGAYNFDLRSGVTLIGINQLGLFSALGGGGGSGSIVVTAAQMADIDFIGADPMSATLYATVAVDMTGTSTLDMSGIDATAFGSPRHTVVINGTVGAETITGSAANDSIVSGGGADVLTGGGGNDFYELFDNVVTITELSNGGTDTISSTSNRSLAGIANVEKLVLQGAAVTGTGNALANTITGNNFANTLDGGAGVGIDTLSGGFGNDIYVVRKATDVVQEMAANEGTADHVRFMGTSGTYTLTAFVEKLTLAGSSAIGGKGNTLANTIVGNGKANTIRGMAGNDTLSGGVGADKFVFNTTLNKTTNVDHITDFSHAQGDKILLDDAVMAALGATGSLGTQFYAASGATNGKDANDHIVYNTKNGALYYDSNGSGNGGTTLIAMLDNKAVLVAGDFAIV